MDQNKERIQILSDVRRGELGIPEAINRLQALATRSESAASHQALSSSNREIHIIRNDLVEDKVLMDIWIPLDLLDAADRLSAQIQPLLDRIPPNRLEDALVTRGTHKLLDEIDAQKNEHLEIYLD